MTGSENRWLRTRDVVGDAYDARYERLAAAGEDVHGEANFVMRCSPTSVLDAGCGTGRVARELARRGVDVEGVDIDEEMLQTARRKAPDLRWQCGDLVSVEIGRRFSAILVAGNVMILLTPGTESAVVANLVRHLEPGGLLIAGFQLLPDRMTIEEYDRITAAAGLVLIERWSTWGQAPWKPDGTYALSVHRS
jgi:trans-aconitate methyltransferase